MHSSNHQQRISHHIKPDSQILGSGYNRLKLRLIKINRINRINKIKENNGQVGLQFRIIWMLTLCIL